MFLFQNSYQGPELTLEDEELKEEPVSSFCRDWSSLPYKEPLGKEGLRKKIMEILGEQE